MAINIASIKSALKQAPTRHWLLQRVTAILLIPFTIQLIIFLNLCMTAPYAQTVAWLKSPWNMLSLEVWLLAAFYHAALGLQVVIEDYIGSQTLQVTLVKLINLSFVCLTVAALFFIFRTV